MYLWLLNTFDDPGSRNYQFLGWENVGGHRCLKVQVDTISGYRTDMPNRPVYRLWLDMTRGGHALRVDYVESEGVRMSATGIKLAKVSMGKGKATWFPVGGRLEMIPKFSKRYGTTVAGIETYDILDGTLQINQGVADSEFDARAKAAKDIDIVDRPRRDRRGMKQELESKLELADAKANRLKASVMDEQSWWSGSGPSVV